MSKFAAVSPQRHGHLRWLGPQGHSFAAKDTTVPIFGVEVSKIIPSMPITLVKQGDKFQLSAVLSLMSDLNMFVGLNGTWLGSYVPAFFRSHPFRLLKPADSSDPLLCIDEDSGLISDDNSKGEAFFKEDGGLSPALQAVLNFLGELERSRITTDLAVAALDQAGVVAPWPIQTKTKEGERTVEGLHRIDEAALNALSDDELGKLRKNGALAIAYGQLFSMSQISVFQTLARVHAQQAPKPAAPLPNDLDKHFGLGFDTGTYLKFD
jgi:hypothetical protein